MAGSGTSTGGHSPLVNPHSLVLVSPRGCTGAPASLIHVSVIYTRFYFVPRTIKEQLAGFSSAHTALGLWQNCKINEIFGGTVLFIYLCLAVLGLGGCVQVFLWLW